MKLVRNSKPHPEVWGIYKENIPQTLVWGTPLTTLKMKRSGFTLIEILIALTLASLVFLAGFLMLSTFLKTYHKLSSAINLLQTRQYVLTQMTREVRSADSIKNSTPAVLVIKNGALTIQYELTAGKVRRKKDASSAYLTEAGQVKKLAFGYPRPGMVIIEIDDSKTGVYCRNEK